MNSNACLVITSINSSENSILQEYGKACAEKKVGFVLAGDLKSPADFDLPGCEFLSSDTQKTLPYTLISILPYNNYGRKNIAYLHAIKKGYRVLVETDDDNIALPEFWEERSPQVSGDATKSRGWVNMYSYFSDGPVWPRGFSLSHLKSPLAETSPMAAARFCPIQQGLADENPDVDAIYRLSGELPVYFKKRAAVILGPENYCPFNSQNTTWFPEAFPLLYLPSYCSFRMTDIWRSFIAQRILATCNWSLSFSNATVLQKRNEHNLLKDFEQEISGYLNNESIVEALYKLDLKKGPEHMNENMIACYTLFIEQKLIDKKELDLLSAWLEDLETAMK